LLVGYAWTTTGSLWITTNGAASWHRGGLTQVLILETGAGWVWSIASAQPYPSIWRAPAGSTAWTSLGVTPDRTATLTAHGDVAYVVGQQGAGPIAPSLDVFTGTQPVRHESLPCGQGQTYVPYAAFGVSTDGWRVSLINRGHGFSLVGFETDAHGVALGTNGYLWVTRNGGTSWSRVTV
jgi:hypothetical protein